MIPFGKSGDEEAEGVPEGCDDHNRVMLRCAQNIARWWMIDHHKRVEGNVRVSFPGDVVMPRGLVPLALWFGVREYGGFGVTEGARSALRFRCD